MEHKTKHPADFFPPAPAKLKVATENSFRIRRPRVWLGAAKGETFVPRRSVPLPRAA